MFFKVQINDASDVIQAAISSHPNADSDVLHGGYLVGHRYVSVLYSVSHIPTRFMTYFHGIVSSRGSVNLLCGRKDLNKSWLGLRGTLLADDIRATRDRMATLQSRSSTFDRSLVCSRTYSLALVYANGFVDSLGLWRFAVVTQGPDRRWPGLIEKHSRTMVSHQYSWTRISCSLY